MSYISLGNYFRNFRKATCNGLILENLCVPIKIRLFYETNNEIVLDHSNILQNDFLIWSKRIKFYALLNLKKKKDKIKKKKEE